MRPLSAPPVGQATRVVDEALVLEMSGEAEAAEVREVALRNMSISAVDAAMAEQPWPRLEAVSLSQNPLGCGDGAARLWGWLGQCDALRCLNLNFCELASLEVRGAGRRARPRAMLCRPAAAACRRAPILTRARGAAGNPIARWAGAAVRVHQPADRPLTATRLLRAADTGAAPQRSGRFRRLHGGSRRAEAPGRCGAASPPARRPASPPVRQPARQPRAACI